MSQPLVRLQSADAVALVAARWRDAVERLSLLSDAGQATIEAAPPLVGATSGRATVRTLRIEDDAECVLRSSRRGGWLAALRGAGLRSPERIFDELRATCVLHRRGAPVPEPVFALARRRRDGWRGTIATLRLPSSTSALDALREQGFDDEGILTAVGRALRALHDAGGRHPDLHLGNVVVAHGRGCEAQPAAWVIDLDGARIGAPCTPAIRARELARMARSIHRRLPDRSAAEHAWSHLRAAYAGVQPALGDDLERALAHSLRRLPLDRWRYRCARSRNASPR